MKEVVYEYFNAWLTKNASCLDDTFDENVVYSECYGPVYSGLEQIKRWFNDWNKHGKVIEWDIKDITEHQKTCFVQWYFKCIYDGQQSGLDGVSIIQFNNNNKIISVKEYESKKEHYYPYGNNN